eukprot:m.287058 g.287058  ORF g.287058 m.287058 type:complete len:4696 (+) comp17783_c0_seq1:104-14191(+)
MEYWRRFTSVFTSSDASTNNESQDFLSASDDVHHARQEPPANDGSSTADQKRLELEKEAKKVYKKMSIAYNEAAGEVQLKLPKSLKPFFDSKGNCQQCTSRMSPMAQYKHFLSCWRQICSTTDETPQAQASLTPPCSSVADSADSTFATEASQAQGSFEASSSSSEATPADKSSSTPTTADKPSSTPTTEASQSVSRKLPEVPPPLTPITPITPNANHKEDSSQAAAETLLAHPSSTLSLEEETKRAQASIDAASDPHSDFNHPALVGRIDQMCQVCDEYVPKYCVKAHYSSFRHFKRVTQGDAAADQRQELMNEFEQASNGKLPESVMDRYFKHGCTICSTQQLDKASIVGHIRGKRHRKSLDKIDERSVEFVRTTFVACLGAKHDMVNAPELNVTGVYNGWNLESESITLKPIGKGFLYMSEEVTVPVAMAFKLSYWRSAGAFRSAKYLYEDKAGRSTNRILANQPLQALWLPQHNSRQNIVQIAKQSAPNQDGAWRVISMLLQDALLRRERDVHRAILDQAWRVDRLKPCYHFVELIVTLMSDTSLLLDQRSADLLQDWHPRMGELQGTEWRKLANAADDLIQNMPPHFLNVTGLVDRYLALKSQVTQEPLVRLLTSKQTEILPSVISRCYVPRAQIEMLQLVVPTVKTIKALSEWVEKLWPIDESAATADSQHKLQKDVEHKLDSLLAKNDLLILELLVRTLKPTWYQELVQTRYDQVQLSIAQRGVANEREAVVLFKQLARGSAFPLRIACAGILAKHQFLPACIEHNPIGFDAICETERHAILTKYLTFAVEQSKWSEMSALVRKLRPQDISLALAHIDDCLSNKDLDTLVAAQLSLPPTSELTRVILVKIRLLMASALEARDYRALQRATNKGHLQEMLMNQINQCSLIPFQTFAELKKEDLWLKFLAQDTIYHDTQHVRQVELLFGQLMQDINEGSIALGKAEEDLKICNDLKATLTRFMDVVPLVAASTRLAQAKREIDEAHESALTVVDKVLAGKAHLGGNSHKEIFGYRQMLQDSRSNASELSWQQWHASVLMQATADLKRFAKIKIHSLVEQLFCECLAFTDDKLEQIRTTDNDFAEADDDEEEEFYDAMETDPDAPTFPTGHVLVMACFNTLVEKVKRQIALLESNPPLEKIDPLWKPVNDVPAIWRVFEVVLGRGLSKATLDLLTAYSRCNNYGALIERAFSTAELFECEIQPSNFLESMRRLEKQAEDRSILLDQLSQDVSSLDVKLDEWQKKLPQLDQVLERFTRAKPLVTFVKEILDEDVRSFTDAADTQLGGDQFAASPEAVLALVEIHRFFKAILASLHGATHLEDLLNNICSSSSFMSGKDIVGLLDVSIRSVPAFEQLFRSLADKNTQTKNVISNAIQLGRFKLSYQPGERNLITLLIDLENGSQQTYAQSSIMDLQSRAKLFLNDVLGEREPQLQSRLQAFGDVVSRLMQAATAMKNLCDSGHLEYPRYTMEFVAAQPGILQEIEQTKAELEQQLMQWNELKADARKAHPSLLCFHGHLLLLLNEAFFDSDTKALQQFLAYSNPSLDPPASQTLSASPIFQPLPTEIGERVRELGARWDTYVDLSSKSTSKEAPSRPAVQSTQELVIEDNSMLTVRIEKMRQLAPVLAQLQHSNRAGQWSLEARTHLVCHGNTTVDEMECFLWRSALMQEQGVYTLVRPEVLSAPVQYEAMMLLKKLRSEQRLKLACVSLRGEASHLAGYCGSTIKPQSIPDNQAHQLLSGLPQTASVQCVSSAAAGQGKTEYIYEQAFDLGKQVQAIHLHGDVDFDQGFDHLKEALSEQTLIHLSIGHVIDLNRLNYFLTQIVLLRSFIHSSKRYEMLPSTPIFLEVANPITGDPVAELSPLVTIPTQHKQIEWNRGTRLHVSSNPHSHIQIVCAHLQAMRNDQVGHAQVEVASQSQEACIDLLLHYFPTARDETCSFYKVKTFVQCLACQLARFLSSPHFSVQQLRDVAGSQESVVTIRNQMMKALLTMAKEFAARTNDTVADLQGAATSNRQEAAERLFQQWEKQRFKWSDGKQLMVVFDDDAAVLAPLYRQPQDVPPAFRDMLELQSFELEDYNRLPSDALFTKVQAIVTSMRSGPPENYVMAADNFLKMVCIYIRALANIPCVLMGHAGCGKTSLVRNLARMREEPFHILNVHAGTTLDHIADFVEEVSEVAITAEAGVLVWAFFDEANTYDFPDIFAEIICDRRLRGASLPHNLAFVVACNPYSLKGEGSRSVVANIGLKPTSRADQSLQARKHRASRLMYQVQPLPLKILPFVWDYGSLDRNTEAKYVRSMVNDFAQRRSIVSEPLINFMTKVLELCHEIMREKCGRHSVSLRDTGRCLKLVAFFCDMLIKRNLEDPYDAVSDSVKQLLIQQSGPEPRALLLALHLCYFCRIQVMAERERCLDRLVAPFVGLVGERFKVNALLEVIDREQIFLTNCMDLEMWSNIACNTALRENIFAMSVAILTLTPIMVVGKPGNSKSLAMHIINSSLRGDQSLHPLLRQYPGINIISYQGSDESTADGILGVFKKAHAYAAKRSDSVKAGQSVIPVVFIDEIGLAEVSPHKPLKVLHNLLEPSDGSDPTVAVVGISNWELDTAKMSRAIHLARPDPTKEDLVETALAIAYGVGSAAQGEDEDTFLVEQLAQSYLDWTKRGSLKDFHGLRDYYSLIKSLFRSDNRAVDLSRLLQRNFGGLEEPAIMLRQFHQPTKDIISAMDNIQANLEDKFARHLLIAGEGDVALSFMRSITQGKDQVTFIRGSHFRDDGSSEFSFSVLNRIILCMERGDLLILQDLDPVFGALYDMLNQNYTKVGDRRHVRIALGAENNPMCFVHENFRCVVLVDLDRLRTYDTPFLNRFEKQRLTFADVLGEDGCRIVEDLKLWVDKFTVSDRRVLVQHGLKNFTWTEEDAFVGYHTTCIESLVHSCCNNSMDTLTSAKNELMNRLTCDGLARLQVLDGAEYTVCCQNYIQHSLSDLVELWLNHPSPQIASIATFSPVHTHCEAVLADLDISCRSVTLDAFKTQSSFELELERFKTNDIQFLFIEVDNVSDEQLIPAVVEGIREAQVYLCNKNSTKRVVCVFHCHRELRQGDGNSLRHVPGSSTVYVCDQLSATPAGQETDVIRLLQQLSLKEILSHFQGFQETLRAQIITCMSKIQYPKLTIVEQTDETLQYLRRVSQQGQSNVKFQQTLHRLVQEIAMWQEPEHVHWSKLVAFDQTLLAQCGDLASACERFIQHQQLLPLVSVLYGLERSGLLHVLIQDPAAFPIPDSAAVARVLCIETLTTMPSVASLKLPMAYTRNIQCPLSLALFQRVLPIKAKYLDNIVLLRERQLDSADLEAEHDKLRGTYEQLLLAQVDLLQYLDAVPDEKLDYLLVDMLQLQELTTELKQDVREPVARKLLQQLDTNLEMMTHVQQLLLLWQHEEQFSCLLRMLSPIIQSPADAEALPDTGLSELCEHACATAVAQLSASAIDISQVGIIKTMVAMLGCTTLPEYCLLKILLAIGEDQTAEVAVLFSQGDCFYNEETQKQVVQHLLGETSTLPLFHYLDSVRRLGDSKTAFFKLLLNTDVSTMLHSMLEASFSHLEDWLLDDLLEDPVVAELESVLDDADDPQCDLAVAWCDLVMHSVRFEWQERLDRINGDDGDGGDEEEGEDKSQELRELKDSILECACTQRFDSGIYVDKLWAIGAAKATLELVFFEQGDDDEPFFTHEEQVEVADAVLKSTQLAYFLLGKARHFTGSWEDTVKWANTYEDVRAIREIISTIDAGADALPYNPFFLCGNTFEELIAAMDDAEQGGETQPVADNAADPDYTFALHGVVLERIALRRLDEAQDHLSTRAREMLEPSLTLLGDEVLLQALTRERLPFALPQTDTFLQPQLPNKLTRMASSISFLLCSVQRLNSWFTRLLHNPLLIQNRFMPGAPDDDQAAVIAALGGVTRYRCQCGYLYVVGECGGVRQQATCPQCKRPVGGVDYQVVAGQERVDEAPIAQVAQRDMRGYQLNGTVLEQTRVRNLSVLEQHVLDFVVHAVGHASGTLYNLQQQLIQLLGKETIEEALDHCWTRMDKCWTSIQEKLEIDDDNVFSIIVLVANRLGQVQDRGNFDATEQRAAFENDFSRVVRPILDNAQQLHADNCDAYEQLAAGRENTVQQIVEERYDFGKQVDEQTPNLYRQVANHSQQSLFESMDRMPEVMDMHKFLGVYRQKLDTVVVELLQWLPPLVGWCNYVTTKYGRTITAADAGQTTVAAFLKEHDPSMLLADSLFQSFKDAWNEVKDSVDRQWELDANGTPGPTCQELSIDELTDEAMLVICLPTSTDAGASLFSMVMHLVTIHNTIIHELLNLGSTTPSLLYFARSRVTQKSLHALQSSDIISFTWDDSLLNYSWTGLDSGTGRKLHFHFAVLNEILAFNTIDGRADLDASSLSEFPFKNADDEGLTIRFQELNGFIRQDDVDAPFEGHLKAEFPRYQGRIDELFNALSTLLFSLLQVPAAPDTTFARYIQKHWSNSPALVVLRDVGLDTSELRYLQGIYETLEYLWEDNARANMANCYCQTYDEGLVEKLKDYIGEGKRANQHQRVPAEALYKACKRLALRHLQKESNSYHMDFPLNEALDDEHRFPKNAFKVFPANFDELLPQDLCLKHVQWLLNYLQEGLYREHQLEVDVASAVGAAKPTTSVQAPSQRTKAKRVKKKMKRT